MKVYNPSISVILIKAMHRSEIVKGMPVVQSRYQQLESIDITPLLGDNSEVTTTKSTRLPSGTWSIRFADQPHKQLLETVYALIEPMDVIEIRMAHENTRTSDQKLPIVMRGFVSNINREESMAGNGPQRWVTVSGHDFAKVLQLYRICYLPFTEIADSALLNFRFFQQFADDLTPKNMTGNGFAELVVNKIVNPYMDAFSYLSKVECTANEQINRWQVNSSISGSVNPVTISYFNNESLYNIMRIVLDIGVFNEMYLEETEGAPVLVVRPTPVKNPAGQFIQGYADYIDIPSTDIIRQNVSRSDDGVANYFWVTNSKASMQSGLDQKASAMSGNGGPESFVKFNYFNSRKDIYGIRKLEVESVLGNEEQTYSDAAKEAGAAKESRAILNWLEARRKLLADMNQDNVVFESGSLGLRGNEAIKAGMYLRILRGPNQAEAGYCYAHTVTHQFIPFQGFITTAQFDRGTFFIERSQFPISPYYPEIESQGIS